MADSYFGPKLCDCECSPIFSTDGIYVEKEVDGELKKFEGEIFVEWCPKCNHFEVTANN